MALFLVLLLSSCGPEPIRQPPFPTLRAPRPALPFSAICGERLRAIEADVGGVEIGSVREEGALQQNIKLLGWDPSGATVSWLLLVPPDAAGCGGAATLQTLTLATDQRQQIAAERDPPSPCAAPAQGEAARDRLSARLPDLLEAEGIKGAALYESSVVRQHGTPDEWTAEGPCGKPTRLVRTEAGLQLFATGREPRSHPLPSVITTRLERWRPKLLLFDAEARHGATVLQVLTRTDAGLLQSYALLPLSFDGGDALPIP